MSRKVFITDIDGCMLRIPFEEYFALKYNLEKPVPSPHWQFDEGFGIPKDEADKVWKYIWKDPWNARPFPGALEFVTTLQYAGIEVHGFSARPAGEGQAASVRDCKILGLDGLFFSEDKSHKAGMIDDFLFGQNDKPKLVGLLEDNITNIIQVAKLVDRKSVV